MKKVKRIEGSFSLFLVLSIVVVCAGIVIMSCGDPQQKASNIDAGAFAVDFSLCPSMASSCMALAEGSDDSPAPDVSDTELTVEAWVKSKAATVNGGIFGRMDASRGISLYVNNNEPKFGIRVMTSTTSTPGAPTPTAEYIVGSGVTLIQDVWTHIAGVISNNDHTATHAACAGAEAETPHLDIHVDGTFQNCATTFGFPGNPGAGVPPDPAVEEQFADNPGTQQIQVGTVMAGPIDGGIDGTIEAVIDEVRLWLTGRTASEIDSCKDTELGIGGTCDRLDKKLAFYYRFNEGEGHNATDISGNAMSGSLFIFPGEIEFENGWTGGNPDMQRAD